MRGTGHQGDESSVATSRGLPRGRRLVALDALVAGVVVLYGLPILPVMADGWRLFAVGVVSVAMGAVMPWRRHRPLTVLIWLVALAAVHLLLGAPVIPADVLLALAVYTLASRQERARSLAGAGAVVAWMLLAILPNRAALYLRWSDIAALVGCVAWAWTWGSLVRTRRAYIAGLQERARQAEREREVRARAAVAEERARISRDLHDIVSHSLGSVVVMADGAAATVDRDPQRAKAAMRTVRDTGRAALGEMRGVLTGLRDEGEGPRDGQASHAPVPGLAQLGDLVDRAREAGLPVRLTVSGETADVPTGVATAAYRVVQEALTNVRKHAGTVGAVEVRVAGTGSGLRVRVRDDGSGSARPAVTEGGVGLVGMRERVTIHGGTLRVGPRREGGFEVDATFPCQGER